MPSEFHLKLNDLRMNLLTMATRVEEAVKSALESLLTRRSDLAYAVIDGDEEIDEIEMSIEEQCLELLALRQPMAVDLRFITSALQINSDLERVGDLAVNIAERAAELSERPPLPFPVDIQPLANTALSMLQDSITAFIHGDTSLALDVCKRDAIADDLAREFARHLLKNMTQHTPAIERSVSYIIISRCLERVADMATNVCEAAVFHVEGKNIKHHHYQNAASSAAEEAKPPTHTEKKP